MSYPVIDCQQLYKQFGNGELSVKVLNGINLTIQAKEQVAIVGSSGSGKSTLLHLLGGLDEPSSGEVSVMGKCIHQLKPAPRGRWRNQHLGFVYQFHHLLPEFSALENVAMPLLVSGEKTRLAQQRAEETLGEVGLAHRLQHKPSELSGGERQRAAIARALVTQPRCILADEPTGNLDQKTALQVYERMLELNQRVGTSLVLVTHDMTLANKMDRVLHLVDGYLTENV